MILDLGGPSDVNVCASSPASVVALHEDEEDAAAEDEDLGARAGALAELATLAKLKIGWDLEAGSTKNEMPSLEFELGEKSLSSTCKFTRKS